MTRCDWDRRDPPWLPRHQRGLLLCWFVTLMLLQAAVPSGSVGIDTATAQPPEDGTSAVQETSSEPAAEQAAVDAGDAAEAVEPDTIEPETPAAAADAADAAGATPAEGVPAKGPMAAQRRSAFLIRVPVPIVNSVDAQVKRAITRVLEDWPESGERPTLVLEFWPPAEAAEGTGSEFERALSLARFLASSRVSRAQTVAYVPRTVVGHAVLPVLACERIIMHPDAELGAAGIDETAIDPIMRRGYSEIAEHRLTVPRALALGMLDKSLVVYRADTTAGTRYVLAAELPELETQTTVRELETVVAEGDFGRFTGTELRLTHGIASDLATERRQVATALGLGADELDLDPSLGEQWRAIRVDVVGPVTDNLVSQLERAIEEQRLAQDANLICVYLDSPGGAPAASVRLANYLSQLDSSRMRTTAFLSDDARGDAALIALACDHVVVTPDSVLGGAGAYQPSPEERQDLVAAVRALARDKSRRWSLPAAMFDPDLEVRRYQIRDGSGVEFFSADELAEQQNSERYEPGPLITEPGRALMLEGDQAEAYGVARYVVEGFGEFKQLYGLESDPISVEPTWAHRVVETLATPQVAGTLLFFAGMALIFELSSPGIGLGGFVACVCFALYFWSQFLNSTASWLEIVLFVTGVACIAVEIFVIPGFGIFGLGGAALVMASLVLASQTFIIPRNEYQAQQLPKSLGMVAAAVGGIVVGVVVLRRYLDRAPVLRRMLLPPPAGEELDDLQQRESLVHWSHLLNQTGTTATPLRPAGKAYFQGQLVDVITDGEMLEKGVPVVVTEIRGNRVQVAAAEPVE